LRKAPKSHGSGDFDPDDFRHLGKDVVIEPGVMVFHPENIELCDRVYIGHNTILKGYFKGLMKIGAGTWIGQQCFIHSAGGVIVGEAVGIGPGVKIITSEHGEPAPGEPVIGADLVFGEVSIGDGADIGAGAIILPGAVIGKRVRVGAGAVVKGVFPDDTVIAGIPAKIVGKRGHG